MAKVYLDPGHGGIDPGAEGCGKKESECALAVARKVMELLPGRYFEARMSRNSQNIPDNNHPNSDLNRRAREANAWGADIYVSIHLNAGGGHGIETLHSVVGGKSTVLAQDIQTAVLAACPGYTDRGLKTQLSSDGVHDRVCVIRESAMPAALVECGFVDSADDMSHWNADKFAQGITAGICKYFCVAYNVPVSIVQSNVSSLALAPAGAAYKLDTTGTFALCYDGTYQLEATCASGRPIISAGTAGVVDITYTHHDGSKYYYTLKGTGTVGQATGLYVNKCKYSALVVKIVSACKSDTTQDLQRAVGQYYTVGLTCPTRPAVTDGTGGIVTVAGVYSNGTGKWLCPIVAVHPGSTGIYTEVPGEGSPVKRFEFKVV